MEHMEIGEHDEEVADISESFKESHDDLVTHIALDITGYRMATCSTDKNIVIWNRNEDGKWFRVSRWKCHTGVVLRSSWAHPEFGQVLATCSSDRSVNIWEASYQKEQLKWIRRAHIADARHGVADIAFAPRHLGLQLATASVQGMVRIYEAQDISDLTNWTILYELKAFNGRCGNIVWSPSPIHRPLIAVASSETQRAQDKSDDRLVVFELNALYKKFKKVCALRQELPSAVTDIQFNPVYHSEYHQIAIAAKDIFFFNLKVPEQTLANNGVQIGSMSAYQATRVVHLEMGPVKKSWKLRFSRTGREIYITSGDGAIRVFKSLFLNQWSLLTEITPEDSAERRGRQNLNQRQIVTRSEPLF